VLQKEPGWQIVNVSYFFVFVNGTKVNIGAQRWLQKVTKRKKWGMSCQKDGPNPGEGIGSIPNLPGEITHRWLPSQL
jgi:hypothetical protein